MNLLILSVGRRVENVKYFRQVLNREGRKVVAIDIVDTAPALYFADKYYVVKKDLRCPQDYIKEVIEIAKQENVSYVISLIDPEINLLSEYRYQFLDKKIQLILCDNFIIENMYDKYKFFTYFKDRLNLNYTYGSYTEVIEALKKNEIKFPLLAKLRNGSASLGIQKINSLTELETCRKNSNLIYQSFIKGKEFGIDVYFDLISEEIVSVFIKQKISMRAGETDKSTSVFRKDILNEVLKLEDFGGFRGPVDIDMFVSDENRLYINEINPRFGGGYPHAHNCGVNFMELILNNMKGTKNSKKIGGYHLGVVMMKYNGLLFKKNGNVFKS